MPGDFRISLAGVWRKLAERSGAPDAFDAMVAIVGSVEHALRAVQASLPADFPPDLWQSISGGMIQQRERFLRGLEHRGSA